MTLPSERFDEVIAVARAALAGVIRKRDPAGIAALRSVISALENACVVPSLGPEFGTSTHLAGTVEFGTSEAPRRTLSAEEVDRILAEEITTRQEQAQVFEKNHRDLEAAMARYQARVVARLLESGGNDLAHPLSR
jgi:predicted fused transcriptional regulator/phosphomethylpyrimidine kinase